MAEEEIKVAEVSVVELKKGIEVEEKAVAEVGIDCNGSVKEDDVLMNGQEDEVLVNGKEESDNSYVFVSGSDVVVDEGLQKGVSNSEVLEELDVTTESKDGEVEGLEVELEGENGQGGKGSDDVVVENGVSEEKVEVVEVVKAAVSESDGDQTMKDVESVNEGAEAGLVENSETVEELTELGLVENATRAEDLNELGLVENGVKVEKSNVGLVENGAKIDKLTEVGLVKNSAKVNELAELVTEANIMAPYDQEGKEKRTINGVVENGKANLEVTDSVIGEMKEVEMETAKPNDTQLDADEVDLESSIESSVDAKDHQESEDLASSDAHTDLVEGKETEPIIVRSDDAGAEVDELLSDEHGDLDLQPSKPISGNGLPQSANDETLEANCTKSVANLDDIQDPEAPSVLSKEVHISLLEQVESELQTDVREHLTPDAECTVSSDTSLDSVDQHHKEAASDTPEDGPQLDLVIGYANGSPLYSVDQHPKEAASDTPIDGPQLALVNECGKGSPLEKNGDEIPTDVTEVPIDKYTPESLIIDDGEERKRKLVANRSHESENLGPVDVKLDTADRHEIEFDHASDNVELKEDVSLSLSAGREDAFPTDQEGSHSIDSTNINEVEDNGQSKPEVVDEGQTDDMPMPSVLSTCSQPISDKVPKSTILENGDAASESGNNNDETNLGHINTSEVEVAISPEDGSSMSAGDGETVERRPFYFLIKVPRFEDDEIREQIKRAQQELDEKTMLRDSYKEKIQSKRAVCKDFNDDLEAAKLDERNARDILKHKRKEIDATQAVIDKINNAMTLEDIESSIRSMEYKMEHETLPLSEEKQLMREIKRLKHFKGQLSSSISEDELQEALDQKDQIKDRMKSLKKELDQLRGDVLKAEAVTKAAKRKCYEEFAELNKLQFEFRAANDVRQETYISLRSLKRELAEKNKYFWMYKDKEKTAYDYAVSGEKESLHELCVNQVKMVMELWNENGEFRKDYIKNNVRSTLRRLKTLDGYGPHEEPLSIPYVRNDRFIHSQVETNCVTQFPSLEQSKAHVPVKVEKDVKEPEVEMMEQKEAKNSAKPVSVISEVSAGHIGEPAQEAAEEVEKTQEEEGFAKKEEERRKKEEEAKILELLRLEEKAKAKEAMERKKRLAEKAQARAQLRAKKEAEQRQRERERRLRKKEKKKTPGEVSNGEGSEKDVTFEPQSEPASDSKPSEKPGTVTKRHHKPLPYTKATKTAATMPLPLRNRGRRKMQMWMWIGVMCLGAVAVVLLWLTKLSSIDMTAGRGRFGY